MHVTCTFTHKHIWLYLYFNKHTYIHKNEFGNPYIYIYFFFGQCGIRYLSVRKSERNWKGERLIKNKKRKQHCVNSWKGRHLRDNG